MLYTWYSGTSYSVLNIKQVTGGAVAAITTLLSWIFFFVILTIICAKWCNNICGLIWLKFSAARCCNYLRPNKMNVMQWELQWIIQLQWNQFSLNKLAYLWNLNNTHNFFSFRELEIFISNHWIETFPDLHYYLVPKCSSNM